MRMRLGKPLWLARGRPPRRRYATFRGRGEADVVVIGGGITGAGIALAFGEAGVQTVLLEAGLVGRGSTAASSALLLQEPDCGFGELARRYGSANATRIWALSHEAVRGLIATLQRHRIPCALAERDSIFFTTERTRVRSLRLELERRCRAGFDAEWLNADALREATGIRGQGAIRTTGSAQCDPYGACVGLLSAAGQTGARLFERTAVRRIARHGDGVRIHTKMGTIDARGVIVATGYATTALRPLLARFRMKETYVLATRPLDRGARRTLGLSDVMLWDAERPYHYARWTPDHRLLLGGGDRPARNRVARAEDFADALPELRREFERLLPALGALDIEYAWEGLFATTPDGLPYIGPHRMFPGHLFALGYGGNGMTFGFLAARLLLERWLGAESSDHSLFAFGRHRASSIISR